MYSFLLTQLSMNNYLKIINNKSTISNLFSQKIGLTQRNGRFDPLKKHHQKTISRIIFFDIYIIKGFEIRGEICGIINIYNSLMIFMGYCKIIINEKCGKLKFIKDIKKERSVMCVPYHSSYCFQLTR
jgi:hypothetical protein